MENYKFYLEATLEPLQETVALRKEVAAVLDLPDKSERQPDLAYFTSVFVSTGTNLNNAHFLPSELVMAEGTIVSKAVDIEHQEDQIIGHIYSHAFVDSDNNKYSVEELKKKPIEELDKMDLHVVVGSVVYKTRFPEIAKEIVDGKWKVSMETYFRDFDVKIGDMILTKEEAASMGLDVTDDKIFGKQANILKADKVIAKGKVIRVLRDIHFFGVGVVKKPANPASIVLDAVASLKDDTIELRVSDNNLTSNTIEQERISNNDNKDICNNVEKSELQYDDTVGICVNYKKELIDSVVKDQDSEVIDSQLCTKYYLACPVHGDYTDTNCLTKSIAALAGELVEKKFTENKSEASIQLLTDNLMEILSKVTK